MARYGNVEDLVKGVADKHLTAWMVGSDRLVQLSDLKALRDGSIVARDGKGHEVHVPASKVYFTVRT